MRLHRQDNETTRTQNTDLITTVTLNTASDYRPISDYRTIGVLEEDCFVALLVSVPSVDSAE